MPELLDAVPAGVLAIYAHPDDPEVSCGGTLARWAAGGSTIDVVVACQGDKGTSDASADPALLRARREREIEAASKVLGVSTHHLLAYPDGELTDTVELRRQLVEIIRRVRPEAVLCPDPTAAFFGQSYVNHRDHRVIGWAALDAIAPAAWSPLYFPDAGPSHRVASVFLSGTLEPDVWVDVTGTIDAKAEALLCHESQLGEGGEGLRSAVRERAEQAGRSAGVRYAETFRLLRPA